MKTLAGLVVLYCAYMTAQHMSAASGVSFVAAFCVILFIDMTIWVALTYKLHRDEQRWLASRSPRNP